MLKALKKGTEQENDAHGAQRETCSNPGELLDMAKCFNDSMVYYCPVRMNRYIIPQDRYYNSDGIVKTLPIRLVCI